MDTSHLPRFVATPIENFRRTRVGGILWAAIDDFLTHDGSVYAAGITYYALLTLLPFIIFIFSVLGFFVSDPDVHESIVDQIVKQMPEGVNLRNQVEGAVSAAANNKGLFGVIGVIGAAWTSSAIFGVLRRALNHSFDISARSIKVRVPGRLRDLAILFGVVLLLVISTALSAALLVIRAISNQWFDSALANAGWTVVYWLLPFLASYLVFMLVYRLIPLRTLPWKDLRIGAIIAAVAFEVSKWGFSFYITNFASFNEIYGTLGGVIAFLVFSFLVANIMLFAAEITAEAAKDRAARRESKPAE